MPRPLLALCLVPLALAACKRKPEAHALGHDDGKGKAHECKLVAGGRIDKDTVVEAGCNVRIAEPIVVDKGATLRIEAGSRLAFAKGARLEVLDGLLVAAGEASKPVTFTSAEAAPAAGDWGGITVSSTKPGTSLSHAIVEYGGVDAATAAGVPAPKGAAAALVDFRPALFVRATAAPVSLADVVVRHAPRIGIFVAADPAFARFERVHVEDVGGIALDVAAASLGGVTSLTTAEAVRVHGRVAKSVAWPKLTLIADDLHVYGAEGEPAVLTLAPGTVVRSAMELRFGYGEAPGSLVAEKVLFTSAAPTPAPGDWRGLHFDRRSPGTRIEDCIVEYAGREPVGPKPAGPPPKKPDPKPVALALTEEMKDFVVKNTTFRHNAGPAIGRRGHFGPGGCLGIDVPGHGNTSIGQPLCRPKSRLEEELEALDVKMLGALTGGSAASSLDVGSKLDTPSLVLDKAKPGGGEGGGGGGGGGVGGVGVGGGGGPMMGGGGAIKQGTASGDKGGIGDVKSKP